jgi:hypothetical protein
VPYPLVVPKFTVELAAWSVVQVMVAVVVLIELVAIALITGAGSAVVVKV